MNSQFIRVYQKLDIDQIKDHLLIIGDLTGSCGKCKALNLKIEELKCPECSADFKYLTFRNIKNHLPKIQRIAQERPGIVFVDYEDYHRISGAQNAYKFLR